MTKSFNVKAQSAFKKLGAVALITATIFFVACKQTSGGGKPTPTPTPTKYTVALNQAEHGTVTALPEIPADKLMVKDTEITFTATANDGYRVKGWTLDGKPITEAGTNTEYKLKVTQAATVKVSFEEIPKHAITFSVDSTTPNGTLKAKADGVDETSTSPITVEEGKTVTFTAEPSANYKVKEWKVGDTVVTGNKTNTYTHTVTQATTVSVSFEVTSVEGGAVLILSPDKLTIEVTAVTEDNSAITVEGCNETTLASGTKTILTAIGTTVILKGNITGLSCSDNKLTALNVQGLTALQGLSCSNNKLTSLNVQGLTALQKLYCEGNKLTELNVQDLTALKGLWCSGNQLTELNVQGLTALRGLSCEGNKLTELNVQGCAALQTLGCYSNQLNAKAMTELLNALPAREAGGGAFAVLYTEETDEPEGNCKDYTQPAELKTAFDGAKKRNWNLQKMNASGSPEDI